MTAHRLSPWAILALLLATGSPSPVRAAAPAGCAIEARTTLRIGNASAFDGDLVVTDAGGRARLGRNTRGGDGTAVVADDVRLGHGADVFDVVGTVRGATGATIRGTLTSGDFPRGTSCAVVPATCGNEEVRVEKGGTRALQPKVYGNLVVEDGASVVLASGAYTFCSIHTGRHVSLSFAPDAPTSIAVVGDLVLGNATSVGSSSGSPVSPPTFEVGGDQVKLGAHSSVAAVIRSPLARLSAGTATVLTGGACARTVDTGWHSELRCAEGVPTTTSTSVPSTSSTTVHVTTSTTSSSSSSTTGAPTTSTTVTTTTVGGATSTSTTLPGSCVGGFPNRVVEPGEQCDDGNVDPTDGCTSACTICGNGILTAPEACDDGNLINGDGCDANCRPTGCGNGLIVSPETCDDGNTDDADACPSDCIVDPCTPTGGTDVPVSVTVTGNDVGVVTLLVDYPEGKVSIPGSGASIPAGIFTDNPFGSTLSPNDFDHALKMVVLGAPGSPLEGLLFNVHFESCEGAAAIAAGEFPCRVLEAADTLGNPIASGVTCAVDVPSPSTTTTSSTSSTTVPSTTTSAAPSTTTSSTSSTIAPSTTTTSAAPTTTTTSSTSSTTVPTTTSTSTTSSTQGPTTTAPLPTTTSTSTSTSTSSTTHPPLCGNSTVNAGETCDDGNNSDNDSCPADCVIDACTPITTSQRFVSLQFAPPPGGLVAGLTVLLDYPEGKVDLPGNGTSFPSGTLSGAPSGSTVSVNDLNFNGKGHAIRVTIAGPNGNALPAGQIVRFKMQDCTGAIAPTADQFLCSVVKATDPFLNDVDGVRCFVVLP